MVSVHVFPSYEIWWWATAATAYLPRRASLRRRQGWARLPQSCHQPCKSKARKSEGRATSAMESVQSQIASAPRYTAGTQRCRWVGCHRRGGGAAELRRCHICTLAHCMAWCFSYMYLALPQLFFVSHQAAALAPIAEQKVKSWLPCVVMVFCYTKVLSKRVFPIRQHKKATRRKVLLWLKGAAVCQYDRYFVGTWTKYSQTARANAALRCISLARFFLGEMRTRSSIKEGHKRKQPNAHFFG